MAGAHWWCSGFVVLSIFLAASADEDSLQEYRHYPDLRYETDDAVIVEVLDRERLRRSILEEYDEGERLFQNGTDRESRQFVGWPGVLPIGPCFTSKGYFGRCTSFRQCYPYFKLPELSNWETWVLGMYDTCSYFTASGKQAFGVCCTNPATIRPTQPPRPTPPTEEPEEPEDPDNSEQPSLPNPNPIPPNWPPPIPTHPPDHTIPPLPTHPPSPGWPGLPETTTLKPIKPSKPTKPTHPRPPTTTRPTPQPWPPTYPTHPTKPTRPTTQPTTTRPTLQPWPPTYPTHPTRPPTTAAPTTPVDTSGGLGGGVCGSKDQQRIVGGTDTQIGEWPWIAALFNGGRQFCGGSLIDNIHILSAAHCVAHMSSWDVSRVTVRLGDHNIKTNTETRHIEKKVKRVVRHRGFDSRTLYNDIAILTLDSPVTFTKQVQPICLPAGRNLYAGQSATVIGWGSLRESGPQPGVLQKVTIPIWQNSECRQKYGNAAPGGIVEHFVCAGQAGRDSCSGDSGGPLMVDDGRWTQIGIVSWGIGCGKGQYPGVYTRVTHFMNWITKNLK